MGPEEGPEEIQNKSLRVCQMHQNYNGNVFIWFYRDKTAIGQNRNKQ